MYGLVPENGEIRGAFNASDTLALSGTVDLSILNGPVAETPITCENGLCVFSARVGVTPIQAPVTVTLTDAVGNEVSYDELVSVVKIVNGEIQPVIPSTQIIPRAFDRSLGRMIQQVGLVDVDFSMVGAFPISINFEDCVDANNEDRHRRYFASIEEIDAGDASDLSRRLKFILRNDDYDVDNVTVSCQYRFAYLVNGALVNDDVVDVPVTFLFGNNADGLPETYDQKLQDAIDAANDGILNKIAKFEKFVKIARAICNLWLTVKSFLSALQGILTFFGISTTAIESIPLVGPPAATPLKGTGLNICLQQEALHVGSDTLGEYATIFCNIVTCRFSLSQWLLDGAPTDMESLKKSSNILYNLGEPSQDPDGGALDGDSGSSDSSSTAATNTPQRTASAGLNLFGDKPSGSSGGGSGDSGGDSSDGDSSDTDEQSSNRAIRDNFASSWARGIGYTAGTTEDSLILSMLNLCIPGIIKNLHEWREIKCRYALCLRDDVPQGVPISACESEQAYAECKYIYGEIFNLINLIFPFDAIFNFIKQMLASPAALIGFLWGGVCAAACAGWAIPWVNETPHGFCAIRQLIEDLGTITRILTDLFSGNLFEFGGGTSACDLL